MARRDDDSREFEMPRPRPGVPAWTWFLIAGIVLLATVIGGLATMRGERGPNVFGPKESAEGERWNLRELDAYVKSKGFGLVMQIENGEHNRGVWVDPQIVPPTYDGMELGQMEAARREYNKHARKNIVVRLTRDSRTAHDQAVGPDPCFSWGRFVFTADDPVYLWELKGVLYP